MRIAVLGGGISGIMLSRLLQKKGHECHIFEAQDQLGGLCSTRITDGFVYDLGGGHNVNSRNKDVLEYILEVVGKENWNKIERNTKIYYQGSYVKFPFENGLSDLPKEDNFECLMGYINAHFDRKYLHKPEPHNFHDWILYRFGKGIANAFMIPYNQKTWNYNLKHLGTDWIEGRIPSAMVEEVIKSSIGIATEGFKHQLYFYYPKEGGMQTLINALAEPLKNVHLSTPIVSLEPEKSKWTINALHEFDDVVSTLPIQEMPRIIRNTPPFVSATLESIWYNGVVTVFVAMNKPFNHNYSWLNLPHKENGPANRLTFLSNYSINNAPKGCSSVLAEVTYKAKTLPERSEVIIKQIVDSLHDCGIINRDDVLFTDSASFKYAYPVYGLKFHEFMQITNNYLNEIKLKRFGRFSTHSYYNIDHIVEKAFEFVDKWY